MRPSSDDAGGSDGADFWGDAASRRPHGGGGWRKRAGGASNAAQAKAAQGAKIARQLRSCVVFRMQYTTDAGRS